MATNERPEPSVTITLREIYDQMDRRLSRLERWMWALPLTVLTSGGSVLVALVK